MAEFSSNLVTRFHAAVNNVDTSNFTDPDHAWWDIWKHYTLPLVDDIASEYESEGGTRGLREVESVCDYETREEVWERINYRIFDRNPDVTPESVDKKFEKILNDIADEVG